jgi:hypothetical protein
MAFLGIQVLIYDAQTFAHKYRRPRRRHGWGILDASPGVG